MKYCTCEKPRRFLLSNQTRRSANGDPLEACAKCKYPIEREEKCCEKCLTRVKEGFGDTVTAAYNFCTNKSCPCHSKEEVVDLFNINPAGGTHKSPMGFIRAYQAPKEEKCRCYCHSDHEKHSYKCNHLKSCVHCLRKEEVQQKRTGCGDAYCERMTRDSLQESREGDSWEEELAGEFNWEALFGKNSGAEKAVKEWIRTKKAEWESAAVRYAVGNKGPDTIDLLAEARTLALQEAAAIVRSGIESCKGCENGDPIGCGLSEKEQILEDAAREIEGLATGV